MPDPRIVICVLGDEPTLEPAAEVVADVGGGRFTLDREFSAPVPDPEVVRSFSLAADLVDPSFGPDDEAAVARHRSVAYVLSAPLERADAFEGARSALRMVSALLGLAGATAVKCESSGIAHSRERWLELARGSRVEDPVEQVRAVVRAWVRRPLLDAQGVTYSCGMHLLGGRDVELPGDADQWESVRWIDALEIYSLAEAPGRSMREGQTFSPTAQDAPRRLVHRPCDRYPDDDFFFNPYGLWRLEKT